MIRHLFIAAFVAVAAYTCYLALGVNAASPLVIVGYGATSVVAWGAALVDKARARLVKWAWVAVSLVVIYAIISGPLDYLRLP